MFHHSISRSSLRERFLSLRELGLGSQLANEVLGDPLVEADLLPAASAFLLRGFVQSARDEIVSIASETMARHLEQSWGKGYVGEDDDSFRTFLYRLCLRHVRWARGTWLRSGQQQNTQPPLGVLPPDYDTAAPTTISPGTYQRAGEAVANAIANWADCDASLKTVMLHWLEGRPAQETAQTIRCCLKTVTRLREQGLARLRLVLANEGLV